jgi:cell division protein FtsZ
MAIRLNALDFNDIVPRIIVFGVGGAGGNAVNNMIETGLQGVEFVVANTDAQALARSKAERRIQIGGNTTQGLGAGAQPSVGMAAAEESTAEILEQLGDTNMVFITAGMGGGTGTGAAPVIARAAKEKGILTVAVVTKPFHFEGNRRMKMAEMGLAELHKHVDTLIVIPNQNLFRVANERTTFQAAFSMADQVLHSGVRSITDLMVNPGLINLDFADVRAVMSEMGKAMMGTGEATGDRRAMTAANAAINNPLLDDISLKGARGVLINITGGADLTLFEIDEAANHIREQVDPDANIIIGSALDAALEGTVRVSVVATGIDAEVMAQEPPQQARPGVFTPRHAGAGQPQAAATPGMGQPHVVRVGPAQREPMIHAPVAQPMAQPAAMQQPVPQQPAPQQPAYAVRAPMPTAPVSAPVHHPAVGDDDIPPMPAHGRLVQEAAVERRDEFLRSTQAPQPVQQPQPQMRQAAPQPHQQPQPQRAARAPGSPFTAIFSRPKAQPQPPVHDEDEDTRSGVRTSQGGRGGLFDGLDDDVEIPAFLRRQSN